MTAAAAAYEYNWYYQNCYGVTADCWASNTTPTIGSYADFGNAMQYNYTNTANFIPNGDGTQYNLNPCPSKPNYCFGGYIANATPPANGTWCYDYSATPAQSNCKNQNNGVIQLWIPGTCGGGYKNFCGMHLQPMTGGPGSQDFPFASAFPSNMGFGVTGTQDYMGRSGTNPWHGYLCADLEDTSSEPSWIEYCGETWTTRTQSQVGTGTHLIQCMGGNSALVFDDIGVDFAYFDAADNSEVFGGQLGSFFEGWSVGRTTFINTMRAADAKCGTTFGADPSKYALQYLENGAERGDRTYGANGLVVAISDTEATTAY
jgi:hypothetical protein